MVGSRKGTEWSRIPGPRHPDEAETKPGEAKERRCMRCGNNFWSQHRGVRHCDYCRHQMQEVRPV